MLISKNTLVLNFDGTELEGVKVKVRPMTLRDLRRFNNMADEYEKNNKGNNILDAMDENIKLFLEFATSWNIQVEGEDGTPVDLPLSLDGFDQLDVAHSKLIVDAWMDNAFGRLASPLGTNSNSGETFQEEELAMEEL